MALVLKDRVLETSTSTGTGAFTLGGAQTGFQSFSVIGSGNTTYYTIQGKNADGTLTGEWEVGTGTYTTGSLARDTVLESSNANALVNFSSGDKDVFCDLPAEKVLVPSGTSSQLLANDGSGGLSNVTIGSNLTYSAGTLSATGGSATPIYTRTPFTATGGQTSFTVTYTVGYVEVYLNGVLLNDSDYTATSGTAIVLATAATAGDIIETIAYTTGAIATVTNLSGGAANQIAYQTAPSTTSFITAPSSSSTYLQWNGTAFAWASVAGMTYPGAGIPNSTGSAWGTSYTTSGTGTVLALATSPTFVTPALGTPSSGTLTSCTGLPIGGISATGTPSATNYLRGDGTWSSSGTVTSVGGTGTVNGLTLTGTVTSSGNLTLGGTLDLSSPPAIGATAASTGAFTYISTSSSTSTTPTLSFNASNSPYAAGATISGSYLQHMLQNKSATAGASTNYVLSNDSGTDSTFYGEFGMNSSAYASGTYTDYFSMNNGVYFSSHDSDVTIGSGNGFKTYFAWGTAGQSAHVINASGAIGLNTNLGTTAATTGTNNFGTAGQVLTSAGSAATPTWSSTPTLTGTNFTGIPNGGLTNSAITFGATSQALGSTVSALNSVSVGATTASTGRFAGITATAGTTTVPPIQLTSGTNLTSATAGAIEYDGVNFYATTDTTNGRNVVPEYQQFYLSSNVTAFGPASGDFFGGTSSASLAATTSYDIECYCYFLKTTAGTGQWIPTFSTALTVGHSYLEYTPVTGFTTAVITGAMVTGEATGQTLAVLTHAATAALTTAVSHIAKLRIRVLTNTACNFRLKFVGSAGTITPQAGSWYTVRKVTSNAGNFVA